MCSVTAKDPKRPHLRYLQDEQHHTNKMIEKGGPNKYNLKKGCVVRPEGGIIQVTPPRKTFPMCLAHLALCLNPE